MGRGVVRGGDANGIVVRAEVDQFQELFGKSSHVPAALRTALRRRIRDAGKVAAADSKRTVLQPPLQVSRHRSRSRGLRSGIAAGITVKVLTGNTQLGVAIATSGKHLAADQRPLIRDYDKAGGWRHVVFGNREVWVRQRGRPYFRSVIPRHQPQVTTAVREAMADAVRPLENL